MKSVELSVKYHGFHPSEFTKSFFGSMLQEIHEEAPYGSMIHANFSRHHEHIKGVIQINSSAGSFFAVATSTSLNEVAKKLVHQLRKRLEKWKTRHVQHRSLTDLTIRI